MNFNNELKFKTQNLKLNECGKDKDRPSRLSPPSWECLSPGYRGTVKRNLRKQCNGSNCRDSFRMYLKNISLVES